MAAKFRRARGWGLWKCQHDPPHGGVGGPGATSAPWYARFLEIDEMTAESNGGSLRYLASVSIEK